MRFAAFLAEEDETAVPFTLIVVCDRCDVVEEIGFTSAFLGSILI